MAPRRRLGLLGPAIVFIGLAVGGVGVWYMIHARPVPGDVVDTVKVDGGGEIVVRAESGGERAFVEARAHGETMWQTMIPHYPGKTGESGVAWSATAMTVRCIRGDRAEIFAFAMSDGRKLGGMVLAPNHGPIAKQADGPLTVTDHVRSYEIVSGPDWHQLVGIDLASGRGLWRVELGPTPIHDAGVDSGKVWIEQGTHRRQFQVFNGMEVMVTPPPTSSSIPSP
jgi:hypothetical protein